MGTQPSHRGWPILVGIAMFAGCGQKSSEPAGVSGSSTAAVAPATGPKAAISAPERPTLAGSDVDTPAPDLTPPTESPLVTHEAGSGTNPSVPPSQEFERQTRDPTWAGKTETAIRNRVTKLGARVDTECRHDRCLISLRGTQEEMTDVLAKLETPEGLQGFAQSIYLTAPVEQGGNLVVRAYATFDR
ncbi:MAG: hypothetical protein AB7T06_32785 [Kofleriaceae bacterium]